jgi:hypothetical protein
MSCFMTLLKILLFVLDEKYDNTYNYYIIDWVFNQCINAWPCNLHSVDVGTSPSKPKRSNVEAEFDTSACQNFKSALNRGRSGCWDILEISFLNTLFVNLGHHLRMDGCCKFLHDFNVLHMWSINSYMLITHICNRTK